MYGHVIIALGVVASLIYIEAMVAHFKALRVKVISDIDVHIAVIDDLIREAASQYSDDPIPFLGKSEKQFRIEQYKLIQNDLIRLKKLDEDIAKQQRVEAVWPFPVSE